MQRRIIPKRKDGYCVTRMPSLINQGKLGLEDIFKNEEREIIDQMNLSMNGSNILIEAKVITMIKTVEKENVEGMIKVVFNTDYENLVTSFNDDVFRILRNIIGGLIMRFKQWCEMLVSTRVRYVPISENMMAHKLARKVLISDHDNGPETIQDNGEPNITDKIII